MSTFLHLKFGCESLGNKKKSHDTRFGVNVLKSRQQVRDPNSITLSEKLFK